MSNSEIKSASGLETAELKEGNYIVEMIMKKRVTGGKVEYFLQRKGFENTDNTWKSVENLGGSSGLINEFERQWETCEKQNKSEEAVSTNKEQDNQSLAENRATKSTDKESHGETGGKSIQLTAFDRGLEAEKIIDAGDLEGEHMFLMKWKGKEEPIHVPASLANVKCPQVVITFYEEHFLWHEGGGDRGSVPPVLDRAVTGAGPRRGRAVGLTNLNRR